MRNKLTILVMLAVLMFSMAACDTKKQLTVEDFEEASKSEFSMFIRIEEGSTYSIVYHKDTKVMYAISNGSYNYGTFTVLLDADGTPMLYESK